MSMSDKQVQKAGNNAQQMQAEIINITNVSGIDEKRARESFNEMYAIARKDFTQDAYQCANERVAKFEEALMPKMLKVEGALQKFSDPSFQFLITEAHKTAASTEREADYDLLSELLLHRVKKDKDRKVRVGIKKAIEIVDQVDDDALCALTVAYTIERLFPATGSIIRGLNILENVFSKLCYTNLCQGKEWLDHLEILDAVRLDHISSLKDLDLFYAEQLDGYVCVGIKKESEDYQKALSLLSSGNLPRELLCDHELLEGYVRLPVINKKQMAAVILPIVLRRSALWYIQIKFSSSTVKCIIPHTSNSFFLVLAAAFFGLVACLLSASCLRIDGRGLRILTSRRSSLLIMAYTPCRSFMLVKHRDL